MTMDMKATGAVSFDADAVRIRGKSQLLLCASLFYFRIPRALWKERMQQLKDFGYNAIDVYFPWNYHEQAEGEWDFTDEKDAAAFLRLAAEAGLWVVARPGPYICSEWDGGALPAYLLGKDGVRLRDNNPVFLRYVSCWFDRILPILKGFEAGCGGTVIGVQLDNELDFYGCRDPKGYIGALRDMALSHGLSVPLFACAGQGGLPQATGLARDVVPTCNFYPDDRDPEFEAKVLHYTSTLSEMGYPLLVTETNRAHYLLRRLLSCGAKLLGPYLQVSGTDFGFANATNNWGKPLAFLTSDYDFGGMISPEGHIREEAYEGRLLGRLLEAYGPPLAEASVAGEADIGLAVRSESGTAGPYALALKGGGQLVFLTNLEDRDKELALQKDSPPDEARFVLKAGRSLALPYRVPLSVWGFEGSLHYSTAELFMAKVTATGTTLLLHGDGGGELALRIGEPLAVEPPDVSAAYEDGQLTIAFAGEDLSCTIRFRNGRELKLGLIGRERALLVKEINAAGEVVFEQPPAAYPSEPVKDAASDWGLRPFDAARPIPGSGIRLVQGVKGEFLEELGIYRGYAWYEGAIPVKEAVRGLLVREASDVVSLYADGRYLGTSVPGGSSRYIPAGGPVSEVKLLVRTEIWGHSNFDDIRLPGLRLHATKGLQGVMAVTEARDLTSNWHVHRAAEGEARGEQLTADCRLWPVVNFGGWLTADHPAFECYRRTVPTSRLADSWIIHLQNIQSIATLYVNGQEAGQVNPFDPYLDISPYIRGGEAAVLAVYSERILGLPAGRILLYEGSEAGPWTVSAAGEKELGNFAAAAYEGRTAAELPFELEPGETAWAYASTVNSASGEGWRVQVAGSGLKLTAFLDDRLVARLWLPCKAERPVMTGGSPSSFYLPGVWYGEGKGRLSLMLEAVDQGGAGRLESVAFVPVKQS